MNRDSQMNNAFLRRTLAASVLSATFSIFVSIASAQYTNGLYAEFNTSMGSYTCALYYAQSPKAVANFIGLATGQRAWLSLPTGAVKTNPFYAGTTFHRVIAGFMIQGGCPQGTGTGGPGYKFDDEFHGELSFDRPYLLAMANSGPNTNGSQFFITAAPTTWLNRKHSIFGEVKDEASQKVVDAIETAKTGAGDRPAEAIKINSVTITE